MAAFMTVANVVLIPVWGIVGAAIAAAITNAGTNAWNLLEVRKVPCFSPFSRSYACLSFRASRPVRDVRGFCRRRCCAWSG